VGKAGADRSDRLDGPRAVTARRWLICALSGARVRWSAARSLPA
jgi:hypothetical protein